jgi:hypothetical protein
VKFRKKPVVIEAVQWTGDNLDEMEQFTHGQTYFGYPDHIGASAVRGGYDPESHLWVHTLEGDLRAQIGDWIIKGVAGEFYSCKPDIFEQTYEPASVPVLETPPPQIFMDLEVLMSKWAVGSADWTWDEELAELEEGRGVTGMDMLRTSIQETGMKNPILLGNDGRVWDGHHRIAAARSLGIREVPVVVVSPVEPVPAPPSLPIDTNTTGFTTTVTNAHHQVSFPQGCYDPECPNRPSVPVLETKKEKNENT